MKQKIHLLIPAILITGLIVSGCGKKQETTAPAEKPAAPAKAATPSVNMQDGKWEITSTIEMAGMPAGMMKPQTFTSCMSQKDYIPKNDQQKECSMKDTKIDGNTVSWEVACPDMNGKGRITYAGTTFDGTTEMTMKGKGKGKDKDMNMKVTMKGKHLGPCDKQ